MKTRELTYELLNGEYLNWSITNGDGRNDDDLRFGQHVHNTYDMSRFKTDAFYKESCEEAYSELLNDLYKREVNL